MPYHVLFIPEGEILSDCPVPDGRRLLLSSNVIGYSAVRSPAEFVSKIEATKAITLLLNHYILHGHSSAYPSSSLIRSMFEIMEI